MALLRTTPPDPRYIYAKKFTLYVLCSASIIILVILSLILGYSMVMDPKLRTPKAYKWELNFIFSSVGQLLGALAAWKENIAAGFVHMAFCVMCTIPYKLERDYPLEDIVGLVVFLLSALVQWFLVRDLMYLRKHGPNGVTVHLRAPYRGIPNPRHVEIKKWVLMIGGSLTSAGGFLTFGIYIYMAEPNRERIIEVSLIEVVILLGAICQWVGCTGAWFERLLYIWAHISLCAIVCFMFGFMTFRYSYDPTLSAAVFALFYFSAMLSLSFGIDITRIRKIMVINPHGVPVPAVQYEMRPV